MKLAGITEVAEILGVSKQRAHQITSSADFPKPADRLAAGPVWRREVVEQWKERNR